MDLGLMEGGVRIGQSFEVDKTCCDTQRANFDHEVVEGDLREKLVSADKESDVDIGTYPCNKYTEISAIHGTRTGEELYLHFFRHIALKKNLEMYALENVPGMKAFPVVMEAMTKLPGYFVNVFCPVSAQLWLPQRRDRLIIIGSRRRFNWREPKSTRQISLAEILERHPKVEIPDYVYKRIRGEYRDLPIISDASKGEIAPTCVAHYSKDRSTRLVRDKRFKHGVRPYTVREYARLQGVPDSFKFIGSESDAFRMIGNGVPIHIGRWLGKEIKRYFNS